MPVDTDMSKSQALDAAEERQAWRVHRAKVSLAAWGVGTFLIGTLWVFYEWQVNGWFQRFAHEGNTGDWNPTLPVVLIGVWALVAGIIALRVHFEPPVVSERLARIGRLRFHAAAWALGLIVLTPINALIEWQDNGGFHRISRDSHPGSWDPWVAIVLGIWAAVIVVVYAIPVYLDRRRLDRRHNPRRARPTH
jgi:hypothetical protein